MPPASPEPADAAIPQIAPTSGWSTLWKLEDWWAVWLGGVLLAAALAVVFATRPADWNERLAGVAAAQAETTRLERESRGSPDSPSSPNEALAAARQAEAKAVKELTGRLAAPFKPWLAKPEKWEASPLDSLFVQGKHNAFASLLFLIPICTMLFGVALRAMGESYGRFSLAFGALFLLAVIAFVLAGHSVIKWANLEYPLWALLVGLSISNLLGTPDFLRPAVRTELYIKTGLVLLGAEVLLGQLVRLGLPGICISWVVTPIVLVATYLFGQRVLKMESKTLNLVISADMSVCGVSAAIATAAACRAKKEELSLAIGISLAFTVVMMVLMPKVILWSGMSRVVGAAWIGGTIDATGAVAAAGEILGPDVLPVAATIKMIQNILIGAIAFAVAVYWVTYEERGSDQPRPSLWEIWRRFPKFILGFVAASVVFSALYALTPGGEYVVKGATEGATKTFREWFFCLAFVSIGLETNFRELASFLKGGKPLTLYVCGQAFSLVLSLIMCWLMLEVVFPDAAAELVR
ncbi:MAG: YeiH family protein [Planctomycetaceae bacterium]